MLKINDNLLEPKGEPELTVDLNKIYNNAELALTKTNFFAKVPVDCIKYPNPVYNYYGNPEIPVYTGDEILALTKYTADSTYDCTLTVTGAINSMTDATKAALFGETADQTNAVTVLIALPDDDFTKITYARNGRAATALEAGDVEVINGKKYFTIVLGLYEHSGATTCATTYFTLGFENSTYKINIDVSGATLKEREDLESLLNQINGEVV